METINTKIINVDFDTFRNQLTLDFSELFDLHWFNIFNEESKRFDTCKEQIKQWFYTITYTPKNDYTKSIKQIYTNINDKYADVEYIKLLLKDVKKVVKNANDIYNNEITLKNKEKKQKENEEIRHKEKQKSINEELNELLDDE